MANPQRWVSNLNLMQIPLRAALVSHSTFYHPIQKSPQSMDNLWSFTWWKGSDVFGYLIQSFFSKSSWHKYISSKIQDLCPASGNKLWSSYKSWASALSYTDFSTEIWKILFLRNTVNPPKQNTMITLSNMWKVGKKRNQRAQHEDFMQKKPRLESIQGHLGHKDTGRPPRLCSPLVLLLEVWPKGGHEGKIVWDNQA